MWFDPKARKAFSKSERLLPATPATTATPKPEKPSRVADVAEVARGRSPETKSDAPDPDGVARTPEAIERVWSEAIRRAVEYREAQTPPTCAHCGATGWDVSVTEFTGRKLHVKCWQAETKGADQLPPYDR